VPVQGEPGGHGGFGMKIAMLIKNFATTGGSNRYAVELSTRLARRTHEVHVYAQGWDDRLIDGLTMHRIRSVRRPRYLNSLFYAIQVRSLTRDPSFDVVHSHQRTIDHHVLSMHHPCYQAGWIGWSPRHAVYRWLESRQFGCRSLTHVIAVSEQARSEILARYELEASRVRVIYPGVDVDRMSEREARGRRREIRAQLGIDDEALAMILVGSEFKRKGLRYVIEALGRLQQAGPLKDRLHLIVIGSGGGSGGLGEFQRLAVDCGVGRWVHFIGLCRQVEHYYGAADLFVLPTLNEPFGMAVLEAMACGLPVIVSREAGVAESLEHGKTALLLDNPRNPEEIAAAVIRLSDAGERTSLGQRAAAAVRALTWDRMTGEVEGLYREVIQSKPRVA
jgi:UDP-glucose:(heptosyl)LPS alpha-1,3-glucosyltransferase